MSDLTTEKNLNVEKLPEIEHVEHSLPPHLTDDNNATDEVSTSSSSDNEIEDIIPKPPETNQVLRRMSYLVILLVLIALHFGQPKISIPPEPYPFFPSGSLVSDWYQGELVSVFLETLNHDISFIMYYAPWDAESQEVRKEFDQAASFYYKRVFFGAVNCWQPDGECSKERSRHGVRIWPGMFIRAMRGQKEIMYRGPNTAPYFIRFLRNVMEPVQRITTNHDLVDMVQKHDAIIYATVETGSHYNVFYKASLKLLEMDPLREIGVAVSTSILPENNIETPSLQLITSNGTIMNTNSNNWTVDYILNWSLKHLHRPIGWTSPQGGVTKSRLLSSFIQNHPTLILFTPRNPFLDYEFYYQVVRSISLQFYNCGNQQNDEYFLDAVLKGLKQQYRKIESLYKECKVGSSKKIQKSIWVQHCSKASKNMANFNTCLDRDIMYTSNLLANSQYCTSEDSDIDDEPQGDLSSPENLQLDYKKEKCRFLSAAKKFINYDYKPQEVNTEINGLSCKINTTLAITVMDSIRYAPLANALGINVLDRSDKTAAVIVDAEKESHFIMNESFSHSNVVEFLVNFTSRHNLQPDLLSRAEPVELPQHYQMEKCENRMICLDELNTENFEVTINQPGKAFMVLYYSSQCTFCTDASRIFLNLANLLKDFQKYLKFVRIDGEKHSLPWHFNMPQYPTILYVPAFQKTETRAFSAGAIRTIPNLIQFLVSNLQPPFNLEAMWLLCDKSKEFKKCLLKCRVESRRLLQVWIKKWRYLRKTREASYVLKKVKYLRNLYLLFSNNSIQSTNKPVRDILDKLLKLSNGWWWSNLYAETTQEKIS